MYKYLSATLALAICSITAFAQHKQIKAQKKEVYLRIGTGYNIPSSAQRSVYSTPLNGSLVYNDYGLIDYNVKKASFNAGMQANLAIGIMLNNHVGLELNNVVGVAGVKYQGSVSYPDNGYDVKEQYTKRASGTFFTIPSLVLQYGNKVQLYSRTGAVLPIVSRIENAFSYTASYNNTKQNIQGIETLKHRFNAGIATAIGVKGKITKGLNGWVELNYTSLSLSTNKAELTSYYVNGQNMLSLVTNTTQQYAAKSTGKAYPTVVNPYSSMGLHLGISFVF